MTPKQCKQQREARRRRRLLFGEAASWDTPAEALADWAAVEAAGEATREFCEPLGAPAEGEGGA